MPHLENWSLYEDRLAGIVSGHKRCPDGIFVITSAVSSLDTDLYLSAITHSGTEYTLGQPKKDWVEWLIQMGFPSGQILKMRI